MRKLIIVIILLIVPGSPVSSMAQNQAVNAVSLGWGPANVMHQDLIFSPFAHSDISLLNVGLSYQRDKQFYQEITLSYSGYNPSIAGSYDYLEYDESKTTYPHSFHFIRSAYVLGGKLFRKEQSQLILGGLINSEIQILNYSYGRIGHFGYSASFGLGFSGKFRHRVNNNQVMELGLNLPVLFWIARSPYLVNDDEFIKNTSSHNIFTTFGNFVGDGQGFNWNSWQQYSVIGGCERKIIRNLHGRIQYNLFFTKTDEPRKFISFNNSLYIMLKIRW